MSETVQRAIVLSAREMEDLLSRVEGGGQGQVVLCVPGDFPPIRGWGSNGQARSPLGNIQVGRDWLERQYPGINLGIDVVLPVVPARVTGGEF